MGTAVLRPQDFWADTFRPLPLPPISRRSSRPHRRPSLPRLERPEQRRKSPSPSTSPNEYRRKSPSPLPSPPPPLPPSSPSPSPSTSSQPRELIPPRFPRRSFSVNELQTHYNKFGAHTPQMDRARIMMGRRQSLDTIDATRMKRDLNTMTRGGLINKKYTNENDVYAGSAFFVSPSPSSLPLPSFFNTNKTTTTTTTAKKHDQFHDSATRDLRRLLRLE